MKRALSVLVLSATLVGTACASRQQHLAAGYLEHDWLIGTWRIDSYIRNATHGRDILLHLTFLPNGFVDVVDMDSSSDLATRCRWQPRVNWIDTSCKGVGIRVFPPQTGAPKVELSGAVQVPYRSEECGRWGVDADGNRVCMWWREVERYRSVTARGEGVLEPYS
jgi:hypothetical protein